jgi:hypothetical protein
MMALSMSELDDELDQLSSSPSIHDEIDFQYVYALRTFVATEQGQANAFKGDAMILLNDTNSYWWLVRLVKDSSVGFLPAEHIETPWERLARLNKHRNEELCSHSFHASNGLARMFNKSKKKPLRKTVSFTSQAVFVSASEYEYSDDEAESGDDSEHEDRDQEVHEKQQLRQQQQQDAALDAVIDALPDSMSSFDEPHRPLVIQKARPDANQAFESKHVLDQEREVVLDTSTAIVPMDVPLNPSGGPVDTVVGGVTFQTKAERSDTRGFRVDSPREEKSHAKAERSDTRGFRVDSPREEKSHAKAERSDTRGVQVDSPREENSHAKAERSDTRGVRVDSIREEKSHTKTDRSTSGGLSVGFSAGASGGTQVNEMGGRDGEQKSSGFKNLMKKVRISSNNSIQGEDLGAAILSDQPVPSVEAAQRRSTIELTREEGPLTTFDDFEDIGNTTDKSVKRRSLLQAKSSVEQLKRPAKSLSVSSISSNTSLSPTSPSSLSSLTKLFKKKKKRPDHDSVRQAAGSAASYESSIMSRESLDDTSSVSTGGSRQGYRVSPDHDGANHGPSINHTFLHRPHPMAPIGPLNVRPSGLVAPLNSRQSSLNQRNVSQASAISASSVSSIQSETKFHVKQPTTKSVPMQPVMNRGFPPQRSQMQGIRRPTNDDLAAAEVEEIFAQARNSILHRYHDHEDAIVEEQQHSDHDVTLTNENGGQNKQTAVSPTGFSPPPLSESRSRSDDYDDSSPVSEGINTPVLLTPNSSTAVLYVKPIIPPSSLPPQKNIVEQVILLPPRLENSRTISPKSPLAPLPHQRQYKYEPHRHERHYQQEHQLNLQGLHPDIVPLYKETNDRLGQLRSRLDTLLSDYSTKI